LRRVHGEVVEVADFLAERAWGVRLVGKALDELAELAAVVLGQVVHGAVA